jgi:hypothetical protein
MLTIAPRLAESVWNRALALGSFGSVKRLRVFISIRPATDGAPSEALYNALSRSLATNPTAEPGLARAKPVMMRAASLCVDRAIEPTRYSVADYA